MYKEKSIQDKYVNDVDFVKKRKKPLCRNRRPVCAANPAISVDPAVTQLTNGNCASLELSPNLSLEFGFLSLLTQLVFSSC